MVTLAGWFRDLHRHKDFGKRITAAVFGSLGYSFKLFEGATDARHLHNATFAWEPPEAAQHRPRTGNVTDYAGTGRADVTIVPDA